MCVARFADCIYRRTQLQLLQFESYRRKGELSTLSGLIESKVGREKKISETKFKILFLCCLLHLWASRLSARWAFECQELVLAIKEKPAEMCTKCTNYSYLLPTTTANNLVVVIVVVVKVQPVSWQPTATFMVACRHQQKIRNSCQCAG